MAFIVSPKRPHILGATNPTTSNIPEIYLLVRCAAVGSYVNGTG